MDQRRIQQRREELRRIGQLLPGLGLNVDELSDSDLDINNQFIQTPQQYDQFVQEERQRNTKNKINLFLFMKFIRRIYAISTIFFNEVLNKNLIEFQSKLFIEFQKCFS